MDVTYPEIEDFLAAHVIGHEPLPYAEAFAALGIEYEDAGGRPRLVPAEDATPEQLALRDAWSRNL